MDSRAQETLRTVDIYYKKKKIPPTLDQIHFITSQGRMKIKPAYRLSEISDVVQRFVQDCKSAKRSSEESLNAWLISAKQRL